MYEETLFQTATNGVKMVELMRERSIVPGIKVDKGTVVLPGTDDETYTAGFDGLDKRCADYYAAGARFAKWRAVYRITDSLPSQLCIHANAEGLAAYAAHCQRNGLVPIVEPEVLMDGSHSIERCEEVTDAVLAAVFKALNDHHVNLDRILLKPNMVISGQDAADRAGPEEVAERTLRVLQRNVPPAVRGILFLSGGQTEEEATLHLDLINKLPGAKPWHLSFSYGRALQQSAISAWKGLEENVPAAQAAFMKRSKLNSLAARGAYDPSME